MLKLIVPGCFEQLQNHLQPPSAQRVSVVRPHPHPNSNASPMNGESGLAAFSASFNVLNVDGIYDRNRSRIERHWASAYHPSVQKLLVSGAGDLRRYSLLKNNLGPDRVFGHYGGSFTVRIWSAATSSRRWSVPLGQAISSSLTFASRCSPKCTRLSLADM